MTITTSNPITKAQKALEYSKTVKQMGIVFWDHKTLQDVVTYSQSIGGDEIKGSFKIKTGAKPTVELEVRKTVTTAANSAENAPTQAYTIVVQVGVDTKSRASSTGENLKYTKDGKYTFNLTVQNGKTGSAKLTDLPKDKDKTYTVTETKPAGDEWSEPAYSNNRTGTLDSNKTVTVTNTYYKPETTKVAVQKTWSSDYGANLPQSVKVELLRNGTRVNEAILTSTGGWKAEWSNLPVREKSGAAPYEYSVKEVGGTGITYPAGYSVDERDDNNIIRVRYTGEEHLAEDGNYELVGGWNVDDNASKVTAQKDDSGTISLGNAWRPAKTVYGEATLEIIKLEESSTKPIDGVKFELFDETGTHSLGSQTTANGGKATFGGLTEGKYLLKEAEPTPQYDTPTNRAQSWVVTVTKQFTSVTNNNAATGPVGTNHWDYKADVDGKGGTLTVYNQLLLGKISLTKTVTVTGDHSVLSDVSGKTFKFHIAGPDGYSRDVEVSDTATEPKVINGLRYGEYTITEVETPIDNYKWNGVSFDGTEPAKDKSIKVFVDEHDKTYFVTATNTYERLLGDLKLTKTVTWNPNYSQDPPAGSVFTFRVELGNPENEITLGADEKYTTDGTYTLTTTLTQDDINSAKKNSDGTKTATCAVKTIKGIPSGTSYTITEVEDAIPENFDNTTPAASGTVTVDSAGKHNTVVVESEVKNHYFKSLETSISAKKSWIGLTDFDKVCPFTVELTLSQYKGGAKVEDFAAETGKLNLGNDWKCSWSNLPLYVDDQGNAYTYSVEETNISYDEGAMTNPDLLAYFKALLDDTGSFQGKTPKTPVAIKKDAGGNFYRLMGSEFVDGDNTKAQELLGAWHVTYKNGEESVGSTLTGESGPIANLGEINVENNWIPAKDVGATSLTVKKIDSELREQAIEGVKFTLKATGGEALESDLYNKDDGFEGVTSTEGTITFSGLKKGTYILTETGIRPDYLLKDSEGNDVNLGRTWEITVVRDGLADVRETTAGKDWSAENEWKWRPVVSDTNAGTTGLMDAGTLTVTNEIIKGKISIQKKLVLDDETYETAPSDFLGENGKTFTFNIYAENVFGLAKGDLVDTLTVQADGKAAESKELRYGEYKIVEADDVDLKDYEWLEVTFETTNPDSDGTAAEPTDPGAGEDSEIPGEGEISAAALTEDENAETPDEGDTANTPDADDKTEASANKEYLVFVKGQDKTYAVTATNTYERELGGLEVTKTVDGRDGDTGRLWNFTVNFTSPADYVDLTKYIPATAEEGETLPYTVNGEITSSSASLSFSLISGQIWTLRDLPVGTKYTVTELEAGQDGYTTTPFPNAFGEIVKYGEEADEATGLFPVADANQVAFLNWRDPGTLTVRKTVTGGGSTSREFDFTIALTRNGSPLTGSVAFTTAMDGEETESGTRTLENGTVTFRLRHGQSVTLTDLTHGTEYTVTEAPAANYETIVDEETTTGTVTADGTFLVSFVNDYNPPDTPRTPDEPDTPDETTRTFEEPPTETPVVVPELPTPTADSPDTVTILEDDVPTTYVKVQNPDTEEYEYIPEEDVPLYGFEIPETGDSGRTVLWAVLSAASLTGIVALVTPRKKKEEEDR